ncbi:hypothetical protein M011DRAFT_469328 [Sporormia fimetaria CBS 119925]|uniref:DUF7598 domain-containing protein n=1 Tax=Sporormia fimetaria CBS 119925 TaxID=1340428 RepID=A0A6A6V8N3_9PLEO|nr:hypothetical protein M011DRAFT_469328 [Sporormia fimetaria CBS 119925]
MGLLSAKRVAGSGFVILNIVRGLNIIALASVVASSVVMLVKTFVVSKFFFFDATSHVITALAGLFLIISECSLFRGYFARNWPLLSPAHGFVSLGCAMMVIGLNLLGNMNKEATSQESLGLPFWRLLVASGILAIVIGFFNVVASYIFRDKSRDITARQVRSHGACAESLSERDIEAHSYTPKEFGSAKSFHSSSTSSRSLSTRQPSPPLRIITPNTPVVDMGSPPPPASPEKVSGFGFLRSARNSLLPSYHSSPFKTPRGAGNRASSVYSRSTSGETRRWITNFGRRKPEEDVPALPMNISGPTNVNTKFTHLVKPDLAHHPSVRRGEDKEMSP